MDHFTVTCDKCGKQKNPKFPTRSTLSCQSCGGNRGIITFPEGVEDNTIILKCSKCENQFIFKINSSVLLQCPSSKCGWVILETVKTISLSVVSILFEEKLKIAPIMFYDNTPSIRKKSKMLAKSPDLSIKVALPYYSGGPRVQRSVESWIYPEVVFILTDEGIIPPGNGICSQIFMEKNSKSEGLNNKTQPYLIDILSKMVELFPKANYYGYFNSDVILPPGSSIESLIPDDGRKISFHHRREIIGDFRSPVGKMEKKQQSFCGKDGFVAEASVVKDIIAEVKDMVIGGAAWDDGLAVWCFQKYGRGMVDLRYGEIYHISHTQTWTSDDKESTFNRKQLIKSGVKESARHSFNWYKEGDGAILKDRQKPLGLIQPGRIGDILIVLPIAKYYHNLGYKVIWPIVSEYVSLFDYMNYVEIVDIGPGLSNSYQRSQEELKKRDIFEVIDLGIGFGKNEEEWEKSGLSFDEWKYKEAGVPFEERFNLVINRNFHKELDLQKKLDLMYKDDFSITHSVGSKGRVDFVAENAIEIENIPGFTVFDWIGIIEKARHVYCVDSCIAHLVNQLGLAKGRRTFSPLKNYLGRSLAMAVPRINWEDDAELPPKARKFPTVPAKSSGLLLVSLPGLNTGDWPLYPLGVGYLASSLKRDREVSTIHFQKESHVQEILPKVLANFKHNTVGFTCSTFNRGMVRKAIQMVKSILPQSKVILGGAHPTYLPEQMIKNYGADYVVMGEGENSLRYLCRAIEDNLNLKSIKGIAYKDADENVIINSPVASIENLDFLPFPDYSYAEQLIRDSKMGSIITSRGCPVRCNYCSTSHYWGQKIRVHSVGRVLDEIERLIGLYGIEKLFFHDDTFNLTEARVKEICKGMIDRKFNLTWAAHGRVHPISQEMLDAMVEAGCRHVCWGVESGSKELLQSMNKKINFDQVKNAYELCTKYKGVLTTGAFTMVGYPGESDKTIKETCDFLNNIPLTDSPSSSVLYVLPGTQVYKQLKDHIDDSYWEKTDDVFYNTTEHSLETLHKWAGKVNNSGNRQLIDVSKHFWDGILIGKIPVPKIPKVDFKKTYDMPLHFFTIVLNGMPFIRYHIKLLQSLPFDWHWHIVEGVADLKYDTQWSLAGGGKIVDKIHRNGLSNDGTTEYLDLLKKLFPDRISIYRKENGKFWNGKVDMVNAPIPNLPNQCLLWQVDVDEFWDLKSISTMVDMFDNRKDVMAAYVYCYYFVGPNKYVSSMNTWATKPKDWIRVFRFYRGFHWKMHEPPTLVDKDGKDWGRLKFISRDETLGSGISFQHFAYVYYKQVEFKEIYYGYKNAVEYWNKLQQTNGERINPRKFLPWAEDAVVSTWDEKDKGELLYPGEWII